MSRSLTTLAQQMQRLMQNGYDGDFCVLACPAHLPTLNLTWVICDPEGCLKCMEDKIKRAPR